MKTASRGLGVVLSAALWLGGVQSAAACAFHGYTPNPTFVDLFLGTEQVVIARPSGAGSRGYTALETLLGPDVGEVPIEVSDAVRRALAGQPEATVLLARDGSYGPWLEIVVLDAGYRRLVEQVAEKQSVWLLGDEQDRLEFFAKRVNDTHPAIRDIALRELDRAPYAALRALRLPKIDGLGAALETGDEALMPIRVLLAGLSQDAALGALVKTGLDEAIEGQLPYVGAYVTALVELEGAEAVAGVFEAYQRAGVHTELTRERLMQALSVQYKSAPRKLRRAIAGEVAKELRQAPEFGRAAKRHFSFGGAWRPFK